MACDEKSRLIRDYSFALSDYERAGRLLHERSGVMSKEDYKEIGMFAEKGQRENVRVARVALDEHTASHGC